jgi:hypothetical protein
MTPARPAMSMDNKLATNATTENCRHPGLCGGRAWSESEVQPPIVARCAVARNHTGCSARERQLARLVEELSPL